MRNTLQVPLLLSEVQLLWKYTLTGAKKKASTPAEAIDDPKEYTNDTLVKQVRVTQHAQASSTVIGILPRPINLSNATFFPIVSSFPMIRRE